MRNPKTKRQPATHKPAKKTLRIVLVTWRDAVFSSEEESPRPIMMLTLGFLVEDSDSHIAVAHEVGLDGTFRGVTSVPRGMVQNVMRLGRAITIELCG